MAKKIRYKGGVEAYNEFLEFPNVGDPEVIYIELFTATLYIWKGIYVPINGGGSSSIVEYDLTSQLDGVKDTFNIDSSITNTTSIALYYAGQRLVNGINYTVDYTSHTITVDFDIPLDSLNNRCLILVTG